MFMHRKSSTLVLLFFLILSLGVFSACKDIPEDIEALDLPYLEGAGITSKLDHSCGYEFTAKKSEDEIKKEFTDAVKKKGWKPSDKKHPDVIYSGMLFEKGDEYLAINPMSKSGNTWGVTVSLNKKNADVWH